MFAILRSGDMQSTALDSQGEYNQRFLDIINCITGASYSFAKYNGAVSYVNSATPSGWSVVWSSVPLNSFGETGDIQVLLRSASRLTGKYIYAKLYKVSTGWLTANSGNKFNETNGAIITGGENSFYGHGGSFVWPWNTNPARHNVTWLQDLTIKAIPGCLMFSWYNQENAHQWAAGVVERTATAPYESNTDENPVVPFFGINYNTHIPRMYLPKTNTYVNDDSRAHHPSYGMINAYEIKLCRDANGNKVLPLVPIVYTDYREGYIGGNLSTYSGLYRTAHKAYHLLENNAAFSYDNKTYRIWVNSYHSNACFAVEEK